MGNKKGTLAETAEFRYEIVDKLAKWGDDLVASPWYPSKAEAEAAIERDGIREQYSDSRIYTIKLVAKT